MELYQQIFFTSLALAFSVLHLIIYLYNKSLKSYLYFSIFVFLFACNLFFDFQVSLAAPEHTFIYLRIHRAFMTTNVIFALLYLYTIFELKIPVQFFIIIFCLTGTTILAVIHPLRNIRYSHIINFLAFFEVIRIIIVAVRKKIDGVRIITIGLILLAIFSLYDMILDFNLMNPLFRIENGYPFGFLGLILCMAIVLARDLSKKNEKIILQERHAKEMEVERRLLEIEDQRKSRELEEARKLQLSMLPHCDNHLPGIDICFHMETAAEVGGDYYDYYLNDESELTLIIGDATGHGMKAGIMVSVIKGLFVSDAGQSDIVSFLKKSSLTIQRMKLGNLYMAMMLVRLKDDIMTVTSAGMPPIFLYRKKTSAIEELTIKGMPLGGARSFPYKKKKVTLKSGDTILLLSDGYYELFNEKGEIFDFTRVRKYFMECTEKSPVEIVRHLMKEGKKWRGKRPQEDDITFIVFKVK